jgi:hypothetical protein
MKASNHSGTSISRLSSAYQVIMFSNGEYMTCLETTFLSLTRSYQIHKMNDS